MCTSVFLKTGGLTHLQQSARVPDLHQAPTQLTTTELIYSHLKTCQKRFVCDFRYPSCLNLPSFSSPIPSPSHPTFSLHSGTKTPRTTPRTRHTPGRAVCHRPAPALPRQSRPGCPAPFPTPPWRSPRALLPGPPGGSAPQERPHRSGGRAGAAAGRADGRSDRGMEAD